MGTAWAPGGGLADMQGTNEDEDRAPEAGQSGAGGGAVAPGQVGN